MFYTIDGLNYKEEANSNPLASPIFPLVLDQVILDLL